MKATSLVLLCLGLGCGAAPAADRPTAAPVAAEGFVAVEGGRVFYRQVGSGPGIPAVVVHGGPGLPHDYLQVLEALGKDRRVVFYDQLGCGRSDRPTDERLWTLERFVRELEAVRSALGLERIHIISHSWGTMLATDYVLEHPERVASVVLDSPLLSASRFRDDVRVLLAALPDDVKATIERHEAAGTTDSEEYREAAGVFYERHLIRRSPPELTRAFQGFNAEIYRRMWGVSEWNMTGTLASYERADRLAGIRVPVLFLTGSDDEARPETVSTYQRLVPRSELAVLEDASHTKHLEEPERYLAVIGSFLRRHEP